MTKVSGPCVAVGCDRPARLRAGYCIPHYKRWKRRGTTHDITPEERFFACVAEVGDCWVWSGPVLKGGYGKFVAEKRDLLAHRWAYEFLRSEIPAGLHLDHLCRNRPCVNPWHLEPVTARVNLHRSGNYIGVNARKTHCIRGHAFDEANTYWSRNNTHRHCRACVRIRELNRTRR
jgi:hypothetical protein